MNTLQKYAESLPSRITVNIRKTEEGLYAQVIELENCYTQADNFVELIEMVNDAVFSYLDIPEEYREKLGYYAPAKLIEELQRQKWQEAIRNLLKDGSDGSLSISIFNKIVKEEIPA